MLFPANYSLLKTDILLLEKVFITELDFFALAVVDLAGEDAGVLTVEIGIEYCPFGTRLRMAYPLTCALAKISSSDGILRSSLLIPLIRVPYRTIVASKWGMTPELLYASGAIVPE